MSVNEIQNSEFCNLVRINPVIEEPQQFIDYLLDKKDIDKNILKNKYIS